MTKNAKTVLIVLIAGVVLVIIVWFGWDILLRRAETLNCEDGVRHKIDTRDFSTRYAAYSLDLEASILDKASISAKFSPVQLQQLSEATQNAQEFRKYVVAGFNSCGITKKQYAQLGARYQALDKLQSLAGRPGAAAETHRAIQRSGWKAWFR
jgi:hypothetical protein